MEIKNTKYTKKEREKSLSSMSETGDFHQKEIENVLPRKRKSLKRIALEVIAIGTLATGVGLVIAYPGESIQVEKGSNLSKIAGEYNTTWPKLAKRNKLKDADYVQEGQDLVIYKKGPVGVFQRACDKADNLF